MLEAVFGVEVGLPEEVEVEAELVIIKVKVSGPPGSQAAAETQCWLQSHNVSLSPLRPHNPQHSSQHRPALSSNQPPPPGHTVVVVVVVALVVVVVWQNCCSELSPRIPLASSRPILADRDGVFSDDGQHTQGLQHRQGAGDHHVRERIVHLVVQKVHRGVGSRHNQVQKSTSAWKPPTQSNVWCLAQGGWG